MTCRTQTKHVAQTSTALAGRALRALALGVGMLVSAVAWAAPSVTYVAVEVAGNNWRYDYTVNGPIDLFGTIDLVFDYASYANLASSSMDPLITINPPDPLTPLNGDVFAAFSNAALPDGGSATFSVSFDWLGANAPGSQAFNVSDGNGGFVLAGRTTATGSGPSPLPEPSQAALAVAALLALSLARRRAA